MRLLMSALAVLASVPALATTLASPGTKAYKGWTMTCDNLGACVILGAADSSDLLYLRIARPAGATSSPTVKIVLAAQDALKGADLAFRLMAAPADRTAPIGPFPATIAKDDANTASATIAAGAASLAVVDAIRNAATLNAKLLDHEGTFALDGLSAALRDVDARQGRAGTPTALVAKGMTPVGQVPAPAQPPTVEPAAPGSVSAIDKPVISASLTKAASAVCDPDVVKEHKGLEAWRIGPRTILTAVPCQGGATISRQRSSPRMATAANRSRWRCRSPQACKRMATRRTC